MADVDVEVLMCWTRSQFQISVLKSWRRSFEGTSLDTTMLRTLRLRFPKPRNCLGRIDLQTAAEVITIFTVINKVSGFYGILSLFTGNTRPFLNVLISGAQMSGLQMSMYIWSIIGTGVCLWALKQIRDVSNSVIHIDDRNNL